MTPLELASRMLSGQIKDAEIVEFHKLLCAISLSYLASLKACGRTIGTPDETIQDLSSYFVSQLFKRDEQGNFVVWLTYAKKQGVPDEHNIVEWLRKIVINKTKQELIEYYKDRDFISYNIRRSLKEKHFNKDRYDVVKTFKGVILAHKSDNTKPIEPISYNEANKLFASAQDKKSRSKVIEKLLDSLPQNGHARCIRLNDAILIFKNHLVGEKAEVVRPKNKYGETTGIDFLDRTSNFDGFILRDRAFKFIDTYCQDPAHNTPWARHDYWPYAGTVKDFVDTYFEGTPDTMFDCFKRHFPDTSYADFLARHRHRVDYLLKMTMDYLRNYLRNSDV